MNSDDGIVHVLPAQARRQQPTPHVFFKVISATVSKRKAPKLEGAIKLTQNHIGIGIHKPLEVDTLSGAVAVSTASDRMASPLLLQSELGAPGLVLALDALPPAELRRICKWQLKPDIMTAVWLIGIDEAVASKAAATELPQKLMSNKAGITEAVVHEKSWQGLVKHLRERGLMTGPPDQELWGLMQLGLGAAGPCHIIENPKLFVQRAVGTPLDHMIKFELLLELQADAWEHKVAMKGAKNTDIEAYRFNKGNKTYWQRASETAMLTRSYMACLLQMSRGRHQGEV